MFNSLKSKGLSLIGLVLILMSFTDCKRNKLFQEQMKIDSSLLEEFSFAKNGLDTILYKYHSYLVFKEKKISPRIILLDFYTKNFDTLCEITSGYFLIPNADETDWRFLYSKQVFHNVLVYRDNIKMRFGLEYINPRDGWQKFDYKNIKHIENFNLYGHGDVIVYKISNKEFKRINYKRWIVNNDDYINSIP